VRISLLAQPILYLFTNLKYPARQHEASSFIFDF